MANTAKPNCECITAACGPAKHCAQLHQQFVRAVAEHQTIGCHAQMSGHRVAQRCGLRVGIAVYLLQGGRHRGACRRARPVRILVGAQLRQGRAETLAQRGQVVTGIVGAQAGNGRIGKRGRIRHHGTATG